ncbi:hypothetical protein [Hirschia baltica]|uniref:Uncharacterized protein n=1 Tax=Hirschia baltica (strain ATCC 49814 / DSM 5838 / IFAM 1418) TaxID=582402 RepID=C6XP88_HIRBI|nr:hypothetical protein [Hirschia baltica]ACT58374.1 conserved hypothetical protein [Hirschia baltica ATCC 49814]
MSAHKNRPSKEDVFDAFAVETRHDRPTIERYLQDYPEYANELIDLARELSRSLESSSGPLTASEVRLIDDAWRRFAPLETKAATDPLVALSVDQSRYLAKTLDVPRQVITAFKERRVDVETVPRPFLAEFADSIRLTVAALTQNLSVSPGSGLARSYKADAKPQIADKVSFEQLLIDAGVPDARRAELMDQGD